MVGHTQEKMLPILGFTLSQQGHLVIDHSRSENVFPNLNQNKQSTQKSNDRKINSLFASS